MMLGPMKKKVVTTGVISFLIPTVAIGSLFFMYSKSKNNEIKELKVKVAEGTAYAISGDHPIGYVLSSDDIKVVDVKEQSIPADAFYTIKNDTAELTLLALKNKIIGQKLKLAVTDTTMITQSLFMDDEKVLDKDLRAKEFNMITLPSNLDVGDFIDIRILFPNGEDYLVVAGKEVTQIGDNVDSNSITINIGEEEIVRLSCAIIDSYMTNGSNLYATKYVEPYEQLYKEVNVDYIEKYETALNNIIEERTTEEEQVITEENESGEMVATNKKEKVKVLPKESDITNEDIAMRSGISLEDVEIIRKAIKENDTDMVSKYKNKTERIVTELVENYPVKSNVATLIKNNPNIIEELKAKYDVTSLEEQRANILEQPLYKYDDYGELEASDALTRITEKIDAEIEAQKADRKEYLQSLLGL